MKQLSSLFIVVLLFSAVVSSWAQEKTEKEWKISSDKYVFINHHTHTHGEVIEGNYPGGLAVDFGTYSFDEKTGALMGSINFDINETLKAVYGSGGSLSGAAGKGAGTSLSGVYELPYEYHRFKIIKIDADGTAYIEYNNISIVLKSGEKWVNTTSKIDTQQFKDQVGKAKLTTTDEIVNYGILEKSRIKAW